MQNIPLDHDLIARLKSGYQLFSDERRAFAVLFYDKLFARAPYLRSMFSTDLDEQAAKLVAALDAIVNNLERPAENAAMLEDMGKRHAGYGVKPEHYDLVIDLLCESMGETAGDRLPAAQLDEWRLALRLVSDQMIAASK